MKRFLAIAVMLAMLLSLVPVMADDSHVITYYPLRTANNPGYYFSGALLDMGVTLNAGDVDKDTFFAKARITEANGDIQGTFGSFGWDPEKEDYALGDGWAKWNILDAYVCDAEGNPAESGQYVKIDIEWVTRTIPSGESDAQRFDVPATRAAWYKIDGYISFASIELVIEQLKDIPGINNAVYVQGETKHDPLFDKFEIKDAPGGGTYALYRPENASESNKRPLFIWFHGTGERYHGSNPGGNLIGNRVLAFADEELQETLEGCYILAPQSDTSGWGAHRLDDMEALIWQVIEENYVDVTRVIVGGLSMGTAMVGPLAASTTENSVPYAGAIFCSGVFLSGDQINTIASKGIPVYLVGAQSDWATFGFNSTYNSMKAAGIDVKMKYYPPGPVFDGEFYYGAHDAWNYIYNNLVEDEDGEKIFDWIKNRKINMPVKVTVSKNLVKQGDAFDILVSFLDTTITNAVRVILKYDGDKFDYKGIAKEIDGVTRLTTDKGDGEVKTTLMIPDYNAKDLLKLRFVAKEDANLQNEDNPITAVVEYVYMDNSGAKSIATAIGSTSISTTGGVPGDTDGDGIVTLIDLSNIIDMFGVKKGDPQWSRAKFYDFNNNEEIDIADIVYVAKLID